MKMGRSSNSRTEPRRGTHPGDARLYNLRVVFEAVRLNGPLSRADLARHTGLTKQTIGVIADALIKAGLLREEGRKTGGLGKPSQPLALHADGGFAIGLHLDRDRVTGILCDLEGQPRSRREYETPTATPAHATRLLGELVRELIVQSRIDRSRVFGAGLVMPGPFGVETVGPTSLPGWDGVALAKSLSARIGWPVLLENDATASAIAESRIGVARTLRNFCLIYLGVGLGVGVIVDGHPYEGATRNAGEFGHLIVAPDGRPCACGNRGCLERYVSLDAACLQLFGRSKGKHASVGSGTGIASLAEFSRRVGPGNPAMAAWMAEAVPHLRLGINALENLFDPEAIILGGDAPGWVIDGLMERVQPLLPSVRTRPQGSPPRLIRAAAHQDMAALGAATAVIFDALNPSYKLLFRSADGTRPGMSKRLGPASSP
jgi:predicted NBD/HSP70 family sugar kinase